MDSTEEGSQPQGQPEGPTQPISNPTTNRECPEAQAEKGQPAASGPQGGGGVPSVPPTMLRVKRRRGDEAADHIIGESPTRPPPLLGGKALPSGLVPMPPWEVG